MEAIFTHERLEAYQVAREFLALAQEVGDVMPRGAGRLRDQLIEAAESTLLNCAEGAGRRTGADKARFFDVARGSAEECAAALDAIAIRRLAAPDRVAPGRALLLRAVRLLSGLARSARARPS